MANVRKRKTSEENKTPQAVKQKKKRSAPTNTSLLPPCRVCLEPAAGFHYGVNTCEACKGFFRRTLVRQGDYECINHDEKCDIVEDHRNSKKRMCPRCRHLKCIAVGMSPEAIKTGRYTHAKRTKDIMEYHQSLGVSDSVNNSHPCSVISAVTSPSSSFVTSNLSSPAVHNTECSKLSGSCCCAEKSSMHVELSSSVSHSDGNVLVIPAMTPSCLELPHSVGSLEATRGGVASASASPFSPENVSSSSAFTMVDSIMDHQVGQEPNCEKSETLALSASQSLADSQTSPATSPWLACRQAGSDILSKDECRKLIQQVYQSHKQLILSRYTCTKEKMLEMQQLCYDNCKVRMETFGPMGSLSEEEYQDIYQTTGIDVDDRQAVMNVLTKMLDSAIRQAIAFVKTVPGFSELSIKDQINLIKENRFEMGFITQTTGYNPRLKVTTLPSGRCFCEHDMQKICGLARVQQRHQCLSAILNLGLTDEELVLLKCIMLFTVGNADIDDAHGVSTIQWNMTQCLLWLLKENRRPNPNLFFAQMISVFINLKSCAANTMEWIKSQPFSHYAQFRNNELLVEWFSSS